MKRLLSMEETTRTDVDPRVCRECGAFPVVCRQGGKGAIITTREVEAVYALRGATTSLIFRFHLSEKRALFPLQSTSNLFLLSQKEGEKK